MATDTNAKFGYMRAECRKCGKTIFRNDLPNEQLQQIENLHPIIDFRCPTCNEPIQFGLGEFATTFGIDEAHALLDRSSTQTTKRYTTNIYPKTTNSIRL